VIKLLLGLVLLCGSERAAVKNLADAEAAKINPQVQPMTVEELVVLPASPFTEDRPRDQTELSTFKVDAKVLGFKLEADLDYHVVIAGESGQTMIAEFPDPKCAADQATAQRFQIARQHFLRYFQAPKAKYVKVKTPLSCTLIGVGLIDKIHGQTGVAPNGVELHPTLDILCGANP
jgi:hypothetical protein